MSWLCYFDSGLYYNGSHGCPFYVLDYFHFQSYHVTGYVKSIGHTFFK